MPAPALHADRPESVGVDPEKLEALFERAEREVREGLLPSCQLAVARRGRLAGMRTFGPQTNDSLYAVFSCTKTLTSAAAWLLMQEGALSPDEKVADLIPEFGTNGKDVIRVEQLFTHTAGFPYAPYPPREWHDRGARLERFRRWRLNWEPGTRFEYHPSSSMWVVAELIERRSGEDLRDFVASRIAKPLGLPDLRLGLPASLFQRFAQLQGAGQVPKPEELAAQGFPAIAEGEVTEDALLRFNEPPVLEAGMPGGGAVTTAGDLALFYQALLEGGLDGAQLWKPETLREARRIRTHGLVDRWFRKPANRGLGIVVAGGEESVYLGFGRQVSPECFGHGGAGGQIAWADPATGLSFAYCTNGLDRHPLRQGRRGVALSSLAAVCALPD